MVDGQQGAVLGWFLQHLGQPFMLGIGEMTKVSTHPVRVKTNDSQPLDVMDGVTQFWARSNLCGVERGANRVDRVVVAADGDERDVQVVLKMSEVCCDVVVDVVVALSDVTGDDDRGGVEAHELVEGFAHALWRVHDIAEQFAFFDQVKVGEMNESQGRRLFGHNISSYCARVIEEISKETLRWNLLRRHVRFRKDP